MNIYRRKTVHRGKVDPGVSELPRRNELSRGNELSRDHVNRPLAGARRIDLGKSNSKVTITIKSVVICFQLSNRVFFLSVVLL